MNAQAELLREARQRLEAAIAFGKPDDALEPLVYQLNHANDVYKTAAKHVKLHAAAPKTPKAKGAAKSESEAAGAKGNKK
ncbi:unnamed protein product [Symbiodinium sp. CCMP2456]|nr:unnamed protein product [Symbiodinium sp. CCMP2456]